MNSSESLRPQPPPKDSAPRRYKDAPTVIHASGYVLEWCPTHPKATHGVYFQHRLVMEESLGRFLLPSEKVHHKNHLRHDNRLENLELATSHAEHMKAHWAGKGKNDPRIVELVRRAAADPNVLQESLPIGQTTLRAILAEHGIEWRTRRRVHDVLTEVKVRAALQGRTARQAAACLGVHVQTLYNHYDYCLTKRASPGSLDCHREEVLRLSYVERVPREDIARRFGVSRRCLDRSIQRWRRANAKLAELDWQVLGPLRPGPVPGRKALDRARRLQEQGEAQAVSLLDRHAEPLQLVSRSD